MNFHEITLAKRKNLKSLIKAKTKIIALSGGSGCFYEDQKIITIDGSKAISEIKEGQYVLSYNEAKGQKEFSRVKRKFTYENKKPCIKIKLKNGHEIIGTEDHKIFYKGGWHSLKHIVSLYYGDKSKNKL